MNLLHHVNFQVTAVVHLIQIASDDVSNTQMSIISNVQFGFAVFQEFFFGRTLGQRGRSPRFNKVRLGDFDLRVIHHGRAGDLWVFRAFHSLFDRWISGGSWSIMSWFRRRLRNGSIGSSRSELRFSQDRLVGRLTSPCLLAGLHLHTGNQRVSTKT